MWSFLARLRERKLAHWAIAYLAGAWLLLQVLDLLAQPFAWPALVLKAATVLLGIGFFAVLVLAWYHGEKGAQRVSGVELLMLTALLVIAGAAVAVVSGKRGGEVRPATSSDSTPLRYPRTAIAVLPPENLATSGPYADFASALHEELITQLHKVAALSATARTSVLGYAKTVKPIRAIAAELAVSTVLEWSVQVAAERLRVHARLIDAATEQEIWADQYDRNLDDTFAVQSDIAQQIVGAVGTTLGAGEQAAIATAPTDNPEAYRLYLQGREYWRRPSFLRRNLEAAQDLYERSLALDSTFALAYAALSEVHGRMSWFRYDTSPNRLIRQREAAERALRLAPNLPQAHFAMGRVHFFGPQNWQAALHEYRIALKGIPNDPELWQAIGYAHRRLGNWDDVFAALDKVVALDPRNVDALWDLGGGTSSAVHRYEEAIRWYSRALALAPDNFSADVERGVVWVRWRGHVDSLKAALARHSGADLDAWRVLLPSFWSREPDSMLATLRSRTNTSFIETQVDYMPGSLYAAWAHRLQGDVTAARLAFDSALVVLDSAMVTLADDWRPHAARGLALVGLGRMREAQREAQWLRQSRLYRDDPFFGAGPAEYQAMILAGSGETEAAVKEIERLLSGPSDVSVHILRLDPRWDPIRKDPRFQALLVKYADPQPVH